MHRATAGAVSCAKATLMNMQSIATALAHARHEGMAVNCPESEASELVAGSSRQADVDFHLVGGDVGDAVGMVEQASAEGV
jgi:hypothetical protein